jgi:hypothetical protein
MLFEIAKRRLKEKANRFHHMMVEFMDHGVEVSNLDRNAAMWLYRFLEDSPLANSCYVTYQARRKILSDDEIASPELVDYLEQKVWELYAEFIDNLGIYEIGQSIYDEVPEPAAVRNRNPEYQGHAQ